MADELVKRNDSFLVYNETIDNVKTHFSTDKKYIPYIAKLNK